MVTEKCFIKMGITIEVNGSTEKDKGEAFRCIIKLESGIKDSGKATCQTDKENYYLKTSPVMWENLKTTKSTERGSFIMRNKV
jgi:hypothetical protein